MKKIYIISRLYTPLHEAIQNKKWQHTGSPAYYNLIKIINCYKYFDLRIYFLLDRDSSKLFKYKKINISNLDCSINIVPYLLFPFNCLLSRKLEHIVNILFQYIIVFFSVQKNCIYYIDRINILLGHILFLKKGLIVYRLLGITQRLYDNICVHRGIKGTLYRKALTYSNSLVITTNDGSWCDLANSNTSINFNIMFNGCDFKLNKSNAVCPKLENTYTITFISRIVPGKGHQNFLYLISKLRNICDVKFRVFIIGGGSDLLSLRQLSKSYNLDDFVNFTGKIPHSQIPDYLSITDIFVSFNEFGIFGNTFIESCSYGIPVVAYDNKLSLFSRKDNLLLFNDHNLSSLVDLLYRLMTDKEFYNLHATNSKFFFENYISDWNTRIKLEVDLIYSKLKTNSLSL